MTSRLHRARVAGRRWWRRLVSMRTALVLLLLLAIASVPGSLLPQRPLNPEAVSQYRADHPGWGTVLDRLGMFVVFATPWFASIYLLLFVSLVGCLIPRIRVYSRSLRAKPLPAPKNLTRLPQSARTATTLAPAAAAASARRALGRRWRTVIREEPSGAVTVSAEKGYTRELGNLVFHLALLAALVLIALGRTFRYEGSILVVEGSDFCNTVTAFDVWKPGPVAASGSVAPSPFCATVDDFRARYLDTGEPTSFETDLTYYRVDETGADGPRSTTTLRVNQPLRFDGDRLYLISHGYSPMVTVTMPSGRTYTDELASFVPADNGTLLSEGAFNLPDADPATSIGLQGLFAPTPAETAPGVFTSVAPEANDPVLGVVAWQGDLNLSGGRTRSVYSLDTSQMTRTGDANLRVGDTARFANDVTVTFTGYKEWVALQVSHDPTQGWLLAAATTMILGLVGSLTVRRRRIWLRITPATQPEAAVSMAAMSTVSIGGLARSDTGEFPDEFAHVVHTLCRAVGGPHGDVSTPSQYSAT